MFNFDKYFSAATTRGKLYIAPVKQDVPMDDAQPSSSESDDDERSITKPNKSNRTRTTNKNNDVVVISDEEEYVTDDYQTYGTVNTNNQPYKKSDTVFPYVHTVFLYTQYKTYCISVCMCKKPYINRM